MTVELNHTIVRSRDKVGSSRFLAGILGIAPPQSVKGFMAVRLSNNITLDYADADEFHSQHLAFLVADDEFDTIFDRVVSAGIAYYADPFTGIQVNSDAGTEAGASTFPTRMATTSRSFNRPAALRREFGSVASHPPCRAGLLGV